MRRIAQVAAVAVGLSAGVVGPRLLAQDAPTTCAYQVVDYVAGFSANTRTEAIIEFGPSQAEPSEILADIPTSNIDNGILVETYQIADDTYYLEQTPDGGWIMSHAVECHAKAVAS